MRQRRTPSRLPVDQARQPLIRDPPIEKRYKVREDLERRLQISRSLDDKPSLNLLKQAGAGSIALENNLAYTSPSYTVRLCEDRVFCHRWVRRSTFPMLSMLSPRFGCSQRCDSTRQRRECGTPPKRAESEPAIPPGRLSRSYCAA